MAENPTHLEIHTGKTKMLRVAATAPTDPTPQPGDMYINNVDGREAIGFHNESSWVYITLVEA